MEGAIVVTCAEEGNSPREAVDATVDDDLVHDKHLVPTNVPHVVVIRHRVVASDAWRPPLTAPFRLDDM